MDFWHVSWLLKAIKAYEEKHNYHMVEGSMTIEEFIRFAIPEEVDNIVKID